MMNANSRQVKTFLTRNLGLQRKGGYAFRLTSDGLLAYGVCYERTQNFVRLHEFAWPTFGRHDFLYLNFSRLLYDELKQSEDIELVKRKSAETIALQLPSAIDFITSRPDLFHWRSQYLLAQLLLLQGDIDAARNAAESAFSVFQQIEKERDEWLRGEAAADGDAVETPAETSGPTKVVVLDVGIIPGRMSDEHVAELRQMLGDPAAHAALFATRKAANLKYLGVL